jgi:hypothetical protein
VHPEGRIENDFGKLIFSVIGLGVCIHGKLSIGWRGWLGKQFFEPTGVGSRHFWTFSFEPLASFA